MIAIFKQIIVISLISCAAIVINACSDDAKLQPLGANAVILAFGDSLTYGTGTSRNKAYPATLETLINRKVINAGVPGEISKTGLSRLPGLIKKYKPELVIICHGGNDILRKLEINQTQDNIQQMITIARQNNSQVILIGVPQFGIFLDTSPIYQVLADNNKLPIADDILADILGKASLKSDHIHPNAKGYQILAQHMALLLKQTGALSDNQGSSDQVN